MLTSEPSEGYPGKIYADGDYTFYYSSEQELEKAEFTIYDQYLNNNHNKSFATRDLIKGEGHIFEGRMLICRCFGGREIAITFRRLDKVRKGRKDPKKIIEIEGVTSLGSCKFIDSSTERKYAVEIPRISKLLGDLTTNQPSFGSSPTGLLLITGSTNSSKSELTRSLIGELLAKQVENYAVHKTRERRPHLLTFEDPIEKYLFENDENSAMSQIAFKRGLEYTPREKGVDVGSLKNAVDDALRQTPSIFYVGEVREDEDWKELLRFAGTGHLVIATAHAGSLIEAMERIFQGGGAETPAERGQIAQRILGVVHQLKFNVQDLLGEESKSQIPMKFDVLLPALWRRTPAGVAALVSDGLSSVLPNNPEEQEEIDRTSSFGRRYFFERIAEGDYFKAYIKLHIQRHRSDSYEKVVNDCSKAVSRHFSIESIRYDLMGI